MTIFQPHDIRNVAVVAHVDHGKTTLVDAMLKQSYVFRDNQKVGNLIMDSNELERERGITILAKNTAITYERVKINIIDTPGHADFSGEIERVINMADGVLLVVDAVDGVMPQTEIVLKQALRKLLKPIVVINKIDRPTARPVYVLDMVQDLFLDLAVDADQLDFTVLYAAASEGYAISDLSDKPESIRPLFEAIRNEIPHPQGNPDCPFQLQVASLDYDLHLGQIAIGRILNGQVTKGQRLACINAMGDSALFSVTRVFVFGGLQRNEVDLVVAGDIVALTGSQQVSIGDTITDPNVLESLPAIDIQEPTVMMTFGVGTSPFAGQEGKFCTTPQLRQRLMKELRTNVSLRVKDTPSPDEFLVSGRGELHLAVLIETMRREGYEFQVSKPEAVTKTVNGILLEPYEIVIIDTKEEYVGAIYKEMGIRRGEVVDIRSDDFGDPQLEFKISTRGLIGFRSFFLRATRGNGVLNGEFLGYEPCGSQIGRTRSGVLVASASGTAVTYGLNNAQDRGTLFLEPGNHVYEGMVVGFHARDNDIPVNVCKEKKLTNMRMSTAEIAIKLSPSVKMSLEEMLDFIAGDELLEVTPKNLRVRKRILAQGKRHRAERKM
ncbi:translational GTPase TypA [SAR202 cluster bacterium AD-804-J14_MRT_500m]|nr:translational GTPase TypA [SAR202 cluster bacterium AD-804-J14_MRT_500m]